MVWTPTQEARGRTNIDMYAYFSCHRIDAGHLDNLICTDLERSNESNTNLQKSQWLW